MLAPISATVAARQPEALSWPRRLDDAFGGDPAPGKPKVLKIEYRIDAADGTTLSHRIQNTIHAIGNNGPFARE